jgi:DNA polymerase-4
LNRRIIHIHIQAFFIAIARICQPELKKRPVAVAPLQSDRALLLSVSPEARKEGIFKGMPRAKAVKRCPDLMIIPPNPKLTDKASQALAALAARYTPLWEPSRPGHIYLDVTGTERLWGRAKDTASHLRREIKGHLNLEGDAGVAVNKMVSSIASRIMPGEGVLGVDPGEEAAFMAPLKVETVPGIGRVRQKVLLEELNIMLVRELVSLDMENLRLLFGPRAILIHQRALGIDSTPVYPSPAKPLISEEMTLTQDENDDQGLMTALCRLIERCAFRLRKRALFPRKAGLLIRYSDRTEARRQLKLPRLSFWDFDLYAPFKALFHKTCHRRVRVRFMRIWFWDFSPIRGQLSLFYEPSPDMEKKARVIQALDGIRKRYGEDAVKSGRAA